MAIDVQAGTPTDLAREPAAAPRRPRLHRRLLALRRETRALAVGDYAPVDAEPPVFAFRRSHERDAWITALNFGGAPAEVRLPGGRRGRIALSTHLDREGERIEGTLALRADEGVLVKMR